ncbi:MAG TPA: S41 family peptidase [Planctomycetes bacterium]|nr:S41 family peptidase [Planctomycetota bacterium]
MLTTATVFLASFIASPQQDPLTDFIARAEQSSPAQILFLANEIGPTLDTKQLIDSGKRILVSTPKAMLAMGQLQTFSDSPLHVEDLVRLLTPEFGEMSQAVLRVFANDVFYDKQQPATALQQWISTLPPNSAVAYTESQLCLANNAPAALRRKALRDLRSSCYDTSDVELSTLAILALARSSSPISADEVLLLEKVAQGINQHATHARTLLVGIAQEQRFQEKIDTLGQLYQSQPTANSDAPADSLDALEELLFRIERQHMEGENYSREELIGAAADGMLRFLDPHSAYFSGEEFRDFMFGMTQEYGGIGAYVNTVDGFFSITRPIYSGPAYGAGLLSEDRIIAVDGWDTIDQPNDEIIKRLKGPPGTTVNLEVVRRGWAEPHFFNISRERIKIPVVQSDILPGGIVYIELISFSSDVAERLFNVIADAKEQGPVNGVVLDMRNNPGGYLNEAVSICDLFLPQDKLVVTTKSRTGRDREYRTSARAFIPAEVPLTILINKYSASASEIVSGALSIHGRATTIGERTFGKGSVQNIFEMNTSSDESFVDTKNRGRKNGTYDDWEDFVDANNNEKYDYGDRVKLTIAYYYLPDGSTIHTLRDHEGKVTRQGGVAPDIEESFDEVPYIEAREMSHLLDEELIQNYAKLLFEDYRAQAVTLAMNDHHDITSYPEWDSFYTSLDTELDGQSIRRWVRRYLRARVSDARGEVFPGNGFIGDYVEDPVLRRAIKHLLDSTNVDYKDMSEYADLVASNN